MVGNIRVLVVGKANLMRDGLWALLSRQNGFEMLAAVESNIGSIQSAALELAPDVALVHVPVVNLNGLNAITSLRLRWPAVRVLLVSSRIDNYLLRTASDVGIQGCILEDDSPKELLFAIRSVFNGGRYLRPSIPLEDVAGAEKLSGREKEVMRLIATGYRTREIAQQLSLSLKTIEKHRTSLMRKLGLRSATAVAAYAIKHGYVIV